MASKKDAIIAYLTIFAIGIVAAVAGYIETAMVLFALAILAILISPDEE